MNTTYSERDLEELGRYYTGHVATMTREGLHSKSAIAAELAHRDKELDELRAEVERLKADKARLDWLDEKLKSERRFSMQKWDHDGRRFTVGTLNVFEFSGRGGTDETLGEAIDAAINSNS